MFRNLVKLALVLPVIVNANPYFSADEVIDIFQQTGKKVVTFIGYSGKGYQNEERLKRIAIRQLEKLDTDQWIVNIGVTPDGIGQIYSIAKEMGFETRGIVSKKAEKYLSTVKDVDFQYLIEDNTWGGYIEGSKLSPTSQAMVAVSDKVITIGGGDVGFAETCEAKKNPRIETKIYCARMNKAKAIAKAESKKQPKPTYFYGKASSLAPFCKLWTQTHQCPN